MSILRVAYTLPTRHAKASTLKRLAKALREFEHAREWGVGSETITTIDRLYDVDRNHYDTLQLLIDMLGPGVTLTWESCSILSQYKRKE